MEAWCEREAAEEIRVGHDKAEAAEEDVGNEINGLQEDISNTPARSLRGLIAKARAARETDFEEFDAEQRGIVWSIVQDLSATV